jgi:predicted dehydrogenase
MPKSQPTRRGFLQASAATAAGGYFLGSVPSHKTWAADFRSPNEQPGIAFIGNGIRFHTYHGKQALKFGPCIGVCDVDSLQLGRAYQVAIDHHRTQNRPLVIGAHEDYRPLLDNKDVDVVMIGTVDHWHTQIILDALRAGKDVYCEKPVTLTIREGQQILQALEKSDRVLQVGTQQRTEFGKRFAQAVSMMHDGRIGEHKRTTICIGGSRECDALPVCDPPPTLNWEKWLGQCPMVDYRSASEVVDVNGWGAGFPFSRAHRYYRWFYEYSGGKLTDWGAHHVDIAMWALRKMGDDVGPVRIEPVEVTHPVKLVDGMPTQDDRFNCATKFKVRVSFGDGTELLVRDSAPDLGFENGIMFEGSDGRFLVNRGKIVGRPVEDLAKKPLPDDALRALYSSFDAISAEGFGDEGFHMKNFMECCKSRQQPASDMLSHHRMLNVCHAVNVALRLGREIVYDPKTETFGDDRLANSFVEREQRKGYEISA